MARAPQPRRVTTFNSAYRGHPTIHSTNPTTGKDEARYARDGTPTPAYGNPAGIERPCGHCGLIATRSPLYRDDPTGPPNPCLGHLIGVIGACCGHGEVGRAYVLFRLRDLSKGPLFHRGPLESEPDDLWADDALAYCR